MKGREKIVALAGLIMIAVTLVLFFLPGGERETVDWVCLTFFLLAEAVLCGGGILADRMAGACGGIFFRAGAFTALFICCIVSLAVSLVSILWMRPPVAGLVGVQIVLFAAGLILLLVLSAFGRRAGAAQAAEEQSLFALKALEDRVRTLAGAPANRNHSALLERLAEAVRFADGACASALDSELADKLTALETCLSGETAAGEVERRVEELLWTVERRGREAKERKAGKT